MPETETETAPPAETGLARHCRETETETAAGLVDRRRETETGLQDRGETATETETIPVPVHRPPARRGVTGWLRRGSHRAETETETGPETTGETAPSTAEANPPADEPANPAATTTVRREPWSIRWGINLAAWAHTAVVLAMASAGQVMYGRENGAKDVIEVAGKDITAWGTPFVFELTVVVLLLLGVRAAHRGRSPYMHWFLAALAGAAAVYANTQHEGAFIFATASAVNLVLWFVKLRDDYVHLVDERLKDTGRRIKLSDRAMLVAPRITVRAWIISTHHEALNREQALAHAKTWLMIRDDVKVTETRPALFGLVKVPNRKLARRAAWFEVDRKCGLPVVLPKGIEVPKVEYAPPAPAPVPVASAPAAPPASAPAPAAADPRPRRDIDTQELERIVHGPDAKPARPKRTPSNAPTSPAPAGRPASKTTEDSTEDTEEKVVMVGDKRIVVVPLSVCPKLPDVSAVDDGGELATLMARDEEAIRRVMFAITDWHSREKRVSKTDVTNATAMTGGTTINRIAQTFDRMRAAVQAGTLTVD